jgi:carbon-monoxide dehydrogenase medium subunit
MAKYDPSTLETPGNLQEAIQLLKKWGSRARVVAGNTTLYELANQGGLDDVDTVIDLSNLALSYFTRDVTGLHIGAMTRFTEIGGSDLRECDSNYAVKETAMRLTPSQVRNMATIGGSACSGIPFYDMPVTLLALGAEFQTVSYEGERSIVAEDFFVDYFVTALKPEDMLIEIRCPETKRTGSSFVKLGRTSIDFAVVNSAVRIAMEEKENKVSDARIALGAVAGTPIRAKAAENSLIGREPTRENILKAASLSADFDPSPSFHASTEYKKKVVPIVVRNALFAAVDRVQGK